MPVTRRSGLVVALALGCVFGAHRIVDPDPFQRIALGREILANPRALGASRVLYTFPGYPFVDDKWLTSVAVAAAYGIGGSTALMLYQIALAAGVASTWYLMLVAWGSSPPLALAGCALGLVADAFRLEPRPDTATQALAAALVAILASRLGYRRLLLTVPVLLALWANCHGYFVEGLLILAAATAAAVLGDRSVVPGLGGGAWARGKRSAILLAASACACMLHPQGVRALLWPWRQIGILEREPILRRTVQEFFPTRDLLAGLGWGHGLILGGVTVAAVATRAAFGRRSPWVAPLASAALFAVWLGAPGPGFSAAPYRWTAALAATALAELPFELAERRWLGSLLFGGFGVLAVPMVRNLSALPPVALLVLAPAWSRRIERLRQGRGWSFARTAGVASALALVLAGGVAYARLADRLAPGTYRSPGWSGWGIDVARFPVAAVDFLMREKPPGPLLNDFDGGGYLATRLGRGRPVFIADNTSMYPSSFLETYRKELMGEGGAPADPFARFGARSVLLEHEAMETPKLVRKLARGSDWALVYLDRAAAVFVHRDAETSAWLASHATSLEAEARRVPAPDGEAPLLARAPGCRRRLFPDLNFGIFLRAAGRPDLALAEADRMWAAGPATEIATFSAASAEEAGRLPESVPRLETAWRLDPGSDALRSWLSRALYFRALAAAELRDFSKARSDLDRSRALTPGSPGPILALAKIAVETDGAAAAAKLLRDELARSTSPELRAAIRSDPMLMSLGVDDGRDRAAPPKN